MTNFLILDKSFGNYQAYALTLENAEKFLQDCCGSDWQTPAIKDILENNAKYVSKEAITRVIQHILFDPIGTLASKTIEVTDEHRQEVVLYCFKNNVPIHPQKTFDTYAFFKVFKISDLSFFANHESYIHAKGVCDKYEMDQAHDYRVIRDRLWKETTTEKAKVNLILNFIKETSHRDVDFEIIPYTEKA